jgi:hypothetical protein
MIVVYNASIVNFYNATGSLAHFEKINSTMKNALAYYNAGVVAVNSKIVGLALEYYLLIIKACYSIDSWQPTELETYF